ncbi:YdbH domain-containing protein [Pelagerythrobacter sp.]|uniref:intermembrane phospholipid transport protein YdbH family protein n=1 Tax=Pelagerythrobacter sp. TaxID=2800702 RepID=UPI0035AD781B
MALAEDNDNADEAVTVAPRRRLTKWRWRVSLALLLLIVAGLAIAWFTRERIAGNVIAELLEDYDLPARYEIESIGPGQQVLRDVVIGDPLLPDLTVERVVVHMRYGFGTPEIGRIELERPRLFGSWRDGALSFGSLDRVLFRDTDEPPGLPEFDIALTDGRALLETAYGPVGFKAEGAGRLDSGFAGVLAAVAPEINGGGCEGAGASAYGRVTTEAGKLRFAGPLRLAGFACPAGGIRLADAALTLDATADADFAGVEGRASLASGALAAGETRASGVNGTMRAAWRDGQLNARYTLAGRGIAHPQGRLAVLTARGALRARDGFQRIALQGDLEGNDLRFGDRLTGRIRELGTAGQGTLLAPLLERAAGGLVRESRGSRIAASVTARVRGDSLSLLVPNATLRGGSGATLLALSRGQFSRAGGAAPRIAGNFSTGGEGLPQITGRMERLPGRDPLLRLRMAEYTAGDSRLAIPELTIAQGTGGRFGFSGRAIASGALPGGSARELEVPLEGGWSRAGGLAMWRECTDFRFAGLALAELVFERRTLTLCPARGAPILAYGPRGLRIAAGAPSLDLAGRLAGTPIVLASGPIGFAWPGNLSARDVTVALGPPDAASRFSVSNLAATLGREIAGTFDDADVSLFVVPLDLRETSGTWRYAGGVLSLAEGRFTLEDRAETDRFNPLMARDATLTLADNVIRADTVLREPTSEREVTRVAIVHDLGSGTGRADLTVAGLLFDESLQPVMLTPRALGVIANARGVVTGSGRIDWNADGVTSSGRFTSEGLDFAAAFGPVRGAAGTIVFDDLIALTTAPRQQIRVGSVNPGIEVTDGTVEFALREGQFLGVAGGTWPFMGGTLRLRPVDLNLGISERRAYVFEIEGLDAAAFVQNMELGNISATGIFDGTVPIVFDEQGYGRIDGGLLTSRPPGGNVSYVGELTYEDLSPIANYAFEALRSLDYRRMTVGMNGSLSGEIITEVRFEGVSQGEGTSSNFVTRQIAGLPLEFRVNIRAAFAQLLTNLRSLYDPAFVRDPRELGLLRDDGVQFQVPEGQPAPATPSEGAEPGTGLEIIRPDDPEADDDQSVQTQESETMP